MSFKKVNFWATWAKIWSECVPARSVHIWEAYCKKTYQCSCLLIIAQTPLRDGPADRIRYCLTIFLDSFLVNSVDLALECFVLSVIDDLSCGKLDLSVAEKDAAKFLIVDTACGWVLVLGEA